jgi:hypothetical protein
MALSLDKQTGEIYCTTHPEYRFRDWDAAYHWLVTAIDLHLI